MVRRALLVLSFCLLAAGCGGGSGGGGASAPAPSPAVSPTPASSSFVPASGTVTALAANSGNSFGSTLLPASNDGTLIVQSPETPAEPSPGAVLPEYTVSATEAAGQATSAVRRVPQSAAVRPDGPATLRARPDTLTMYSPTRRALRAHPLRLAPSGTRTPQSVRRAQAAVGDVRTFHIDQFAITGSGTACASPGTTAGGFQCYVDKPATLMGVTPHAYVWLANDIMTSSTFSAADMQATAQKFESDFAIETAAYGPAFFGSSPTNSFEQCDATGKQLAQSAYTAVPDLSGTVDAHISIVITNALSSQGEGGYFSLGNLFSPAELECASPGNIENTNQTPLIVIGDDAYQKSLTSPFVLDKAYWLAQDMPRSIAHEFQHYLHAVDKYVQPTLSGGKGVIDDAFIDEGCSMLAQDITLPNAVQSDDSRETSFYYLYAPGNYSLTSFTGYDTDPLSSASPPPYAFYHNTVGDYGQAYLFARYLYDRFGVSALHAIYADRTPAPASGANVGSVVAAAGEPFAQVYREFAAALSASGDPGTTDPRYKFSTNVLLRGSTTLSAPLQTTLYAVFDGPRSPEDLTAANPGPPTPRIKLTPGATVSAKLIQGATLFFNAQPVAGTGATVRASVTGAPALSPQAVLVQGAYTDAGACLDTSNAVCHP